MVQRPESPRQKSWINPQVLLVFLAFVSLTIIIWLNELIDVPHLLLGAQKTPFNWHEALFETFLIVVIGSVSLYLLSRSFKQHELAREDIFREKSFSHILLQSSPSFFVAIDTEGKTTMVNDEFIREIGYTREELIGRDFLTALVPASEHVALAPFFRALARKGMVSVIENHVVAKDGRKLLVEWRGRPVFKENGELDFLFGVGTDITERKKIEKELRKSRERMRTLHKQAQDLRERERARIAREIHDELGQVLTALKMDLSMLKKKLPPEQTSLNTKLAGMISSLETTIETVRRIITDLRPGLLDHLGLFAAIEWQARDFEKRTGITCTLFIEPEEIMLDPESTISLFRIFQEALTNVARHAEASEVTIVIQEELDSLSMTVQDNGKGISKNQIDNPRTYGLMGIRERVYFCGGTVVITGEAGKGTTLNVSIPTMEQRTADDTSTGSR